MILKFCGTVTGLLLLLTTAGYSQQKTVSFTLPAIATAPVATSYSRMEVWYDRLGSDTLGLLNAHAMGKPVWVRARPSLKTQLETFSGIQFATTAQSPELFIQLRLLSFYERGVPGGAYRKVGYGRFKADFYSRQNEVYTLLRRVDTTFATAPDPVTVVEALNRVAGEGMVHLIQSILSEVPAPSALVYTTAQLKQSDSIDKTVYPLYTLDTLREGIYKSFRAFLMQQPDLLIDTSKDKGSVKIWDAEKGRFRNYFFGFNDYAYVRDHKPYLLVANGGKIHLEKYQSDFVFTASVEDDARFGVGLAVGVQFGAIGGLIGGLADAAVNKKQDQGGMYRFAIDPVTGKPVRGPRVYR